MVSHVRIVAGQIIPIRKCGDEVVWGNIVFAGKAHPNIQSWTHSFPSILLLDTEASCLARCHLESVAMLLLPSTALVLALVIGWGARVTARLRDDTAVLRRDCPDYEFYSKARQSVSFLFL